MCVSRIQAIHRAARRAERRSRQFSQSGDGGVAMLGGAGDYGSYSDEDVSSDQDEASSVQENSDDDAPEEIRTIHDDEELAKRILANRK